MWGGRHNPYLCTMNSWRDTFDISFVTDEEEDDDYRRITRSQTRGKKYNTKREEYLDLVKEEFGAFDPYKLDRIWAIIC